MANWLRRLRIQLLGAGLAAGLLVALLLPTEIAHQQEDALARAVHTGTLRIGYAVEPPFAYIGRDLAITGAIAETAKLVAHEMGVHSIEWVQVSFGNLIPELLSGRFDVIAAGMFITPERRLRVAYSSPSLRVASGLLLPANAHPPESDLTRWLLQSQHRVAVLDGAVEGERLRAMGLPSTRMVPVSATSIGLEVLRSQKADALALSWPAVQAMQHRTGQQYIALKLRPAQGSAYDEMAYAFAPPQAALASAWDQALRKVLGSPAHLDLLRSFGFDASDLPGARAPASP
jgi:polar amino acid transport system substrate-binding protein